MLDSLHIKNFRCFEDLTIPSLGRVNLIVGKNNSGKSTLLDAMRIFASKGSMNVIFDILSARDELIKTNDGEDQNFLLALKALFLGREFPDNTSEGIEISERNDNLLRINLFPYVDQFEEVEEKNLGTVRRRRRVPINEVIDGFDEEVKLGISVSFREHKQLFDSYDYYRSRRIPSWRRKNNEQIELSHAYVPTKIISSTEMADLWDKIVLTPFEDEIRKSLTLIEENIAGLAFKKSDNSEEERTAFVKVNNLKEPIPIKSMGEGMSRLLQLFLYAYQAKGGYLLIDEFENGLHYSIQEEVWEKLFKLVKELDIQVFATTHSEDTIKAFCKISLASEEEGRLIALGRSPVSEDNGRIVAVSYDEKEIAVISRTGMEVR